MSKLFATLDEVIIGGSLVLSQGDQIVQTTANVDAHRIARSKFPMSAFQGQVEGIFYSPDATNPSNASVAGVPPLTIGVCTSASSLAKYCGEESTSFGYCPGDGKVYNNNAVLTTFPTAAIGDYIGMVVDPGNASLTYFKNGQPLGSIAITAATAWFYGVSLSGSPGDRAWYTNSGVSPLRFPYSTLNGWWQPISQINPILLASEPFITQHTDTLPDTKFAGDIDGSQNPLKIQRSVQFWPWGTSSSTKPPQLSASGTGSIQLDILDPDGKYGALETNDVRDVPVTISRVGQGDSFDAQEGSFTAYIDHIAPATDQTKTLYLSDLRSLLQVPLYRALFPPNADPSVAGKPRPISLGVCRNYEPTLYDTTNLYYAAHDSNLSALGTQRVYGKPLLLGTDYNLLPDASGFVFPTAPAGKFTAESTSTGAAYDPAGTDILTGSGNFLAATADANGHPTGWYAYIDGYPPPYWQVDSTYGVTTPNYTSSFQTLVRDPAAFTMASGYSYVIQVKTSHNPRFGSIGRDFYTPSVLTVGLAAGSVGRGFAIAGQNIILEKVGTYTVVVNNNTGSAQPFGMLYSANPIVDLANFLGIESIKIQQLPPVDENVPLDAINLDTLLRAVLIDRGPLNLGQYDPSGAQAIDTATGYGYGLHLESNDTPQVQAVAKQILDCVAGDMFQGRNGLMQVVRMIDPSSVSSGDLAGTITVTDINGYLIPYADNAENLTTRLEGCPNYSPYADGDFGTTSLTDVPLTVRAKLKLAYQWTAVSGAQLSPRYLYADNVPALPTLFDVFAHGQTEISRVCAIYTVPRNFYTCTVFSPIGRTFDLGEIYDTVYPLPGLETGKQLMVVGLTETPSSESTDLVLWG